jgi:ribosome recycling factor
MTGNEVLAGAESRMHASVEDLKGKLAAVRTGRASLSILDGISVDYYGTATPLHQVAKLSIPEPSLIVLQPFDPSTVPAIEKAVRAADLGLNPANDGKIVRVPIPPLTEERRKQLIKRVHTLCEDGRTAVRQVRRDANEEVKKIEKSGAASEDDARRWLEEIQKKTDRSVHEIDELGRRKEADLKEI